MFAVSNSLLPTQKFGLHQSQMPVHATEGNGDEFVGEKVGLNGMKFIRDGQKSRNSNLILQSDTGFTFFGSF